MLPYFSFYFFTLCDYGIPHPKFGMEFHFSILNLLLLVFVLLNRRTMSDLGVAVFPGDLLQLPTGSTISIGHGIIPGRDGIVSAIAGQATLSSNSRISVTGHGKRYFPQVEDLIIGTIVEKHSDSYRVDIGTSQPAVLPSLAFCRATKNNKPSHDVGDLIYCRVVVANKFMEPEVSCISPHCTRDWVTGECFLTKLEGGYVFQTSIELARSLLQEDCEVLKLLSEKIQFELCAGDNGFVFVKTANPQTTMIVANMILKSSTASYDQLKIFLDRILAHFAAQANNED